MTPRARARAVLALVLLTLAAPLGAQQPPADVADLRARLRDRYDLAALQDGLALIPRQRNADVRLIEIRDGAVAINGDEVTARELRERVRADADLLLRATYLDTVTLRQLAAPEPPPPAAPTPPSAPSAPAEPGAPGVLDAPPIPAPPAPPEPPRRVRFEGERVRIMGNLTIPRDERIDGDVVVVIGNAYIDGEIDGSVTVVMGNAYFRDTAVVRGEVNVIGGMINRAPGARLEGEINNVGMGDRGWVLGDMRDVVRDAFIWRIGGLAATLLRVALMILLALVVVAFGPGVVERIADRTAIDPLRAGLIGFFAELLFFPLLIITIIVLAVSIIGIPLLVLVPFGVVLAMLVLLVGFTGVAYQIGRTLHARFGWTERGAYASVVLGVLVIGALTVLARSAALVGGDMLGFPLAAIGYLVEYAAWTIGFGAAILVWLRGRQRRVEVPALP
jgi:hypothetical protein